jgi:hypothetical protein
MTPDFSVDREAALRELNTDELAAVAGGYDDGDWCGTGRKPQLPPPPPPQPWW